MAIFDLRIKQSTTPEGPVHPTVRVCLTEWHVGEGSGTDCDVLVTPNCRSLDEVNEQIDRLQGNLEVVRRKARTYFGRAGSGPFKG